MSLNHDILLLLGPLVVRRRLFAQSHLRIRSLTYAKKESLSKYEAYDYDEMGWSKRHIAERHWWEGEVCQDPRNIYIMMSLMDKSSGMGAFALMRLYLLSVVGTKTCYNQHTIPRDFHRWDADEDTGTHCVLKGLIPLEEFIDFHGPDESITAEGNVRYL